MNRMFNQYDFWLIVSVLVAGVALAYGDNYFAAIALVYARAMVAESKIEDMRDD